MDGNRSTGSNNLSPAVAADSAESKSPRNLSFKASRNTAEIVMSESTATGRNLAADLKRFTAESFAADEAASQATLGAKTRKTIEIFLGRKPAAEIPGVSLASGPADLGKAQLLLESFDYISAESVLDTALSKLSKKSAEYISTYGLLGLVRFHLGKSDIAEGILKTALQMAEHNFAANQSDSHGNVLCSCLTYAGEVTGLKGMHKESRHLYRRAVETVLSMKAPQPLKVVTAMFNYGFASNTVGRFDEALPILQHAKELSPVARANSVQYVLILAAMAHSFRGLGYSDKSIDTMELAINVSAQFTDQKDLGRAYSAIAKLLIAAEDQARAEEFFEKCLSVYSRWQPSNNPQHLTVLQDYVYLLRCRQEERRSFQLKETSLRMQFVLQDVNRAHSPSVKQYDINPEVYFGPKAQYWTTNDDAGEERKVNREALKSVR